MNLLSIDTSGKKLSVAVSNGQKILTELISTSDLNHSRDLIIYIDRGLKKSKLNLRKLDGFCVVTGPGSFTGLRIGVTAIKGLAYVTKKKIVGVSSLDVIASNVKNFDGDIVPIIDAKRNQVYAAIYRSKNGNLTRKSKYYLIPIEDLVEKLKKKTIFLGDGVFIYKEIIKNLKPDAEFAAEPLFFADIKKAAELGAKKFKEKEFIDPFRLEPMYLYQKFCSIKGYKK